MGAVLHRCREEAQETGSVHIQLVKRLLRLQPCDVISVDTCAAAAAGQLPREGGDLGQPREVDKR